MIKSLFSVRRAAACLAAMAALAAPAHAAQPSPSQPGAAQPVVTLCYEKMTVLPWRTAEGRGLDFDMLKAVGQRTGISFRFAGLPWKRCLAELKNNKVDGAFSASFRPERLELGAFPGGGQADPNQRMHMDSYLLARRKGSAVSWDGKQFSNLDGPVGAQLGYSIADDLRAMGVAVDDGSQRAGELAMKLQAGRLAAAAFGGSQAALLFGPGSSATAGLELLPVPLVEKPYYLMLSHGFVAARPDLAATIWKTMEHVRNSPEYKKLEREAAGATPR